MTLCNDFSYFFCFKSCLQEEYKDTAVTIPDLPGNYTFSLFYDDLWIYALNETIPYQFVVMKAKITLQKKGSVFIFGGEEKYM